MPIKVKIINQTTLSPQPLRQTPSFLNNKLFSKTGK